MALATTAPRSRLAQLLADIQIVLRLSDPVTWGIALLGAGLTLVLVGIPTAMIDTPLFTRMTPIRPQDYGIWIVTGILGGLLVGTYALSLRARISGRAMSGGILAYLAVGCPICNKIVVALIGTSGALTFFAPLQLYLGLASVALLVWALRRRLRVLAQGCQVPPRAARPAARTTPGD